MLNRYNLCSRYARAQRQPGLLCRTRRLGLARLDSVPRSLIALSCKTESNFHLETLHQKFLQLPWGGGTFHCNTRKPLLTKIFKSTLPKFAPQLKPSGPGLRMRCKQRLTKLTPKSQAGIGKSARQIHQLWLFLMTGLSS